VGIPGEGDATSRFEEAARSAGLVLPASRRINPWLALLVAALIVTTSLAVGYSTGWMNLSRSYPGPLSELPGCSASGPGVTLTVATEGGSSAGLAVAWPSVATAFSTATGGCLSVVSSATSAGFAALSSQSIDALVGPALPGTGSTGGLASQTTDVPLFVSPLVVLVNAEGLSPELNLSAGALAGAYLGTVDRWNNTELTASNPGLRSTLNLTVVYLQGPSQANAVFSTYLAEWNATFRTEVGPGTNLSWPVGLAAGSPAGVESLVASTPGAIGYEPTDVCPSLPSGLLCAAVQAAPSTYVAPTPAEVVAAEEVEANSSAALAGSWANVTGVASTNSSVYPMVETTYAVVYRDLGTTYGNALGLNASKWLIALLFWVISSTGGTAGRLAGLYGYVPLPSGFATTAEETDLNVTYYGGWILIPASALVEAPGESGGGGETGEF